MAKEAPWRDGATQDDRWNGYLVNPEARVTDPDYGVLANRLGITTHDQMRHAESDLSEARAFELRRAAIAGRYDSAHMQADPPPSDR